MVDPSRSRKEGIRCGGRIKKGPRQGQPCPGLILAEDDLSVVCHNCGDPRHILTLLGEVIDAGYLTPKQVLRTVPSLRQAGEEQKMKAEKGARYFAKRLCRLLEEVFGIGTGEDLIRCLCEDSIVKFIDNRLTLLRYSEYADFAIVSNTPYGDEGIMRVIADDEDGVAEQISMRVRNPEYMSRAKRFARRLHTLTKRIQEKPTEVTVIQDF